MNVALEACSGCASCGPIYRVGTEVSETAPAGVQDVRRSRTSKPRRTFLEDVARVANTLIELPKLALAWTLGWAAGLLLIVSGHVLLVVAGDGGEPQIGVAIHDPLAAGVILLVAEFVRWQWKGRGELSIESWILWFLAVLATFGVFMIWITQA